mgnify:CR=1 FL=1
MLKNRVLEAIRHTPLDFNGEGNYFDSTICTIWMCSVAFAMLLVATAASSELFAAREALAFFSKRSPFVGIDYISTDTIEEDLPSRDTHSQ